MKIEVKTLDEMTAKEFCKIAEERTKVFVVEQDCPYQEIDQLDYTAHHLVLRDDQGNFVGYTRIMDKDKDHIWSGSRMPTISETQVWSPISPSNH
jgi:ElaA protein